MKKLVLLLFILTTLLNSKEYSLNLDQAMELALKNNRLNKISKLSLDVAKAQYEQALSANYPTINSVIYATRDKKDSTFMQRGSLVLPSDITRSLAFSQTLDPSFTVPAAFPDLNAYKNYLSTANLPNKSINADLDIKSKGRDTVTTQIEVNYPLYTGGKISSVIEQARLNKYIKKQDIIRDENQVIFDVKKYFYAYILTNELHDLISKIHNNMEFSTELAKDFLENGTNLDIKKTDYLSAKLTTSLINSAKVKIELNRSVLKNALSNLIGLKVGEKLVLNYKKEEILKQNLVLQELVSKAIDLNPDINQVKLAIKVKNEEIKEAASNNKPMINLFANASHTYNSYEYGYLNKDEEDSWSIGIALKYSLFDGFKTKNEILEKKLNKRIVEEKRLFLEEAVSLKLRNEFIKSSLGIKQINILKEAIVTAQENSRMNLKGFEYEMIEARDVVQSQLLEVYIKADYLKSVHDYLVSLATIDNLVGVQIDANIQK